MREHGMTQCSNMFPLNSTVGLLKLMRPVLFQSKERVSVRGLPPAHDCFGEVSSEILDLVL